MKSNCLLPFALPSFCHLRLGEISPIGFVVTCLLLFAGLIVTPSVASGQESSSSGGVELKIGFDGNARLGKWVPIFIDSDSLSPAKIEVEVLDGDDTPVIYASKPFVDDERPGCCQGVARFGRTHGLASLRLLDESDALLFETDLKLSGDGKLGDFVPSTSPIILTLESEDTLKKQIESLTLINSQGEGDVIVAVEDAADLPNTWLAYDSVETIALTTSDSAMIEKLTSMQLEALRLWVENGGKLVLSVCSKGDRLLGSDGPLAMFAPGKYAGIKEIKSSKRLEGFANSREQLIVGRTERISVATFEDQDSIVVLDDGNVPLVLRRAMGLGEVTFVAFDLDEERLVNWKGYANLIGKLVGTAEIKKDETTVSNSSRGSSVSHFGYNDLIGQMRVPLESFSSVSFVAFTWVALLLGLYILCIGPGDYFFLRKLLGKMELTWITFPLLSLIFCGLAIWISQMTRPSEIQLNQFEVVDVDAVAGSARGTIWANLYSPESRTRTVEIDAKHSLGYDIQSDLISWHGLPGDALGGMMSKVNPGLLKSQYRNTIEKDADGSLHSKLVDLPLQSSSTRPMFGQWWADNPTRVRSRLRKDNQLGGQISGTVTNPFDFTLSNARLVFEDWVYILNQELEPGQTFDVQTECKEKTLKSLLTRRVRSQKEKNRGTNSPWDPEDSRISRISDMLMFYEAAGGFNYTGLTHDYQPFVDFSQEAYLKRAVLVAEVKTLGSRLKIDGETADEEYDKTITIVRLVLPVDYVTKQKSR